MKKQLARATSGLLLCSFLATVCLAQSITDFVKLDPKKPDPYLGTYQLASGDLIVISRSIYRLWYHEPRTGRIRALNPVSENTWVGGPSLLVYSPAEFQITFRENKKGEVTSLVLKETGSRDQIAEKTHFYREELVTFRSGDAALAGSLLIPSTKGQHPAAVFIHGSGAQPRNGFDGIMRRPADHFARNGIAVLIYDKRGTGQSTGDWKSESFDDLAGDALAALQFLQSRRDINPKQIGLWGSSQAAWIMPRVAARSKAVAFIISVSGAGTATVAEQEMYDLQNNFAAAGFSQAEIDEWLKAWHLFFDYVRSGEGSDRTQLDVLIQKLAQNPKLTDDLRKSWLLDLQTPVDWKGRHQEVFRYPPDFDPMPLWQQYDGPILGVFGSMDSLAPVSHIPIFAKTLASRKNSDSTIVMLPKGNHTLLESETLNDREVGNLKRYVPGYFDTMSDWLKKRMHVKN